MASLTIVKTQIETFLANQTPEVLCISGEWGVGKTYTWNTIFENRRKSSEVKLSRYSYVSLFGIDSVESLKAEIAGNTVFIDDKNAAPDSVSTSQKILDGIKKTYNSTAGRIAKYKGTIRKIPTVTGFFQAYEQYLFSTVEKQIICFDDLERRNDKIAIKDILGLISQLREQKGCKIAILLNTEELDGTSKEAFEKNSEKVIDTTLQFAPLPQESVEIALSRDNTIDELIGTHCVNLGISNIRVIKKIQRFARMLEPHIVEFDIAVLQHAAHTLALLVWSKCQPNIAPPLDYIRERRSGSYLNDVLNNAVEEEHNKWNAILDRYNFYLIDRFDEVLLDMIEKGYFDESTFVPAAAALDRSIKLGYKDAMNTEAWNLYHSTFEDNEKEVVDAMCKSVEMGYEAITPLNLNGTIRLLKYLGHDDKAKKLIELFIEQRKEKREFWNPEELNIIGTDVIDDDLAGAFSKKYASFDAALDPVQILEKIGDGDALSRLDLDRMKELSEENFVELLVGYKGSDLTNIVRAILKIGSAEITAVVKAALTEIGKQSKINARRVKLFGINVDE